MLEVYIKQGCPYCAKVHRKITELGIEHKECPIREEQCAHELEEEGGKMQVPFLVDRERGISMYESDDIVRYLKREYGAAEA